LLHVMYRIKCLIIIVEIVLIEEQVIHVVNHYLKRPQVYHVIVLFLNRNIYLVH
jgi:hypothetical protein